MITDYQYKKPSDGQTTDVKTRQCLKCRKPFMSEWMGERVCKACKSNSSWRDGHMQVFRTEGSRRR